MSAKIAEVDPTIPELPPKDLIFRIFRDVRFSRDPSPYKVTHSWTSQSFDVSICGLGPSADDF
jgi:uncharacterized protein (DUF2461 family)